MTTSHGNGAVFDVFVALHVICGVVGFGAVALSGTYGAGARRSGPAASLQPGAVSEETARYFRSRNRAELLILGVPVFGVLALAFRPAGSDFGAVWTVVGLVIWAVAAAILLGVVRPAEAAIRQALGESGGAGPGAGGVARSGAGVARSGAGVARSGARLLWASVASDVLFVVALAFMITQPK